MLSFIFDIFIHLESLNAYASYMSLSSRCLVALETNTNHNSTVKLVDAKREPFYFEAAVAAELNTSNEETSSLSATATTNNTTSNSFVDLRSLSFSRPPLPEPQQACNVSPSLAHVNSDKKLGSLSTGLNKYLKKKNATSRVSSWESRKAEEANKHAHAYTNSYLESFSVDPDDPRRDSLFFLPNVPVHVHIIGHEEEPSLVLLHTNFYIINISHGEYNWTVKRRYKNFLKLYEAFALFKTKLNIKNVAVQAHLASGMPSIGGGSVASADANNNSPSAIE